MNTLFFVVLYNGSVNTRAYLSAVVAAKTAQNAVDLAYKRTDGWDKAITETIRCQTICLDPGNYKDTEQVIHYFES